MRCGGWKERSLLKTRHCVFFPFFHSLVILPLLVTTTIIMIHFPSLDSMPHADILTFLKKFNSDLNSWSHISSLTLSTSLWNPRGKTKQTTTAKKKEWKCVKRAVSHVLHAAVKPPVNSSELRPRWVRTHRLQEGKILALCSLPLNDCCLHSRPLVGSIMKHIV